MIVGDNQFYYTILSYSIFKTNSPPSSSSKFIRSYLLLSKEKPMYAFPSYDFRDASLKLYTSH